MADAEPTSNAVGDSQRDAAYNRRKIADECRYNYSNPVLDPPAHDLTEKLKRTHDDYASRGTAQPDGEEEDHVGFDALATRLYATLGIDHGVNEKPVPKQDYVDVDSSPQMQRVLKLLPQRQSMDILMQNFLTDINYHYYIIYPPVFLQDYHMWWERRPNKRPLSLQYTCLLAIVCACALQHVEPASEQIFEDELGDTLDAVSDQLHAAMRELASVIPVGHYHMLNVQRLLHSCYWYKAEAKFLEAWHVLSAAILEGRELGYHKAPPPGTVSDFDLEMRRRLWCILDTWDWQISSGLSRPKIIDRADCDADLPELTLEGHMVSPLLHMKMQSRLTRQLASRFSAPKNIIAPAEVREYKVIIEKWVEEFPPEFAFENPDTSKDEKCPWVFAHRFYVYTMACLLILNPIRHYMVKQYTWESPLDELKIREVGIWYSLKLMKTLRLWVDKVYNRDGRLHFIIFSIFDTAAMLCTALLKDNERTITNRQEILLAIGDAVDMLKKLNTISKTSKTSYDILERLVMRLPEVVPRKGSGRQVKRTKVTFRSSPASSPTKSESTATQQSVPADSASQRQPVVAQPQMYSETRTTTTAVAPQDAQSCQLLREPQQVQPPPMAAPIPAAPLPLPSNNTGPPPSHIISSQYVFDGHEYAQQQQQHAQQSSHYVPSHANYMSMDGGSASTAPNSGHYMVPSNHGHYMELQPIWSTRPDTTLPQQTMEGPGLVSSFSIPNEAIGVDDVAYQQAVVADPGPDFDIENLSETQLGELAPLWSWHSGNLDFANMPPPPIHSDGYSQPM
ncbi:hypothetical protein E4U43_004305 [Claviceps pusilla]|uniref:Xylanolytic transcriptional activator regulatory domain-containing protein n=1 Tax=Claviceps pusilla TaxID=123648 RepID=A0A9P7NF96_9HYPO|nr:hypothetical protein E4U43_004305 [Claviceps pusilla]